MQHFYVSAIDGSRKSIVAGPFPDHDSASDAVVKVSLAASDLDPRAWHYGWGTAGSDAVLPSIFGAVAADDDARSIVARWKAR